MNTFIRLLYSILIAGATVTFIGISILTFYPPPVVPQYPTVPMAQKVIIPVEPPILGAYNDAYMRYQTDQKTYSLNVSIAVMFTGLAAVAVGLYLGKRFDIIGEGLALGGIGNTIYAIGLASLADSRVVRFIAVTTLLGSVILLVYFKFKDSPSLQQRSGKKP
jgi:hypothetical protein